MKQSGTLQFVGYKVWFFVFFECGDKHMKGLEVQYGCQ